MYEATVYAADQQTLIATGHFAGESTARHWVAEIQSSCQCVADIYGPQGFHVAL